jgi:hypothetical protein
MSSRDDVQIGEVVRNAIIFNLNNWRDGAMSTDNLFEAIERLFSLLEERKIEYLLVGGGAIVRWVSISCALFMERCVTIKQTALCWSLLRRSPPTRVSSKKSTGTKYL